MDRHPAPATRLHFGPAFTHSLACANIAMELAREADPESADSAFISGLLHDVGRILLAEEFGPGYVQVIETARRLDLPLEQVELRMLSMSHADVMEPILRAWRLPREISVPVVLHHMPPGGLQASGPRQPPDVLRVIAANRLAHALALGSSGNDTLYPTAEVLRVLNFDAAAIGRIESRAHRQAEEMKRVMLSPCAAAGTEPIVARWRHELSPHFSPILLGEDSAIDAHQILCSRLAGPTPRAPTIAVAYLSAHESQSSIHDGLIAAEHRAGVDRLPLLVVAPIQDLRFDVAGLSPRPVQVLRSPVAIPRFISAVNQLLQAGRLHTV